MQQALRLSMLGSSTIRFLGKPWNQRPTSRPGRWLAAGRAPEVRYTKVGPWSATSSVAKPGNRSSWPAAKRGSMWMF